MTRGGAESLRQEVVASYTPSVDAAYFNLAPDNRRRGGRVSSEITPTLIVDFSPIKHRLLGVEVLGASEHLEGIVDLTTMRNYREGMMKGRVPLEQVLQVVQRIVAAEEQHPGVEAEFAITSMKEKIRIRDLRRTKAIYTD